MNSPYSSVLGDHHQCPMCGYCLAGRSSLSRCPECNFPYDQKAEVIRFDPTWRDKSNISYGLLLFAMLVWVIKGREFTGVHDTIIFALLLVLTIVFYLYRVITQGNRGLLILNREGVQFLFDDKVGFTCDWSKIQRAKYSQWFGKFKLLDNQGSAIYRCPGHKLGGPKMARRCARAVNQAKQVYHEQGIGCAG